MNKKHVSKVGKYIGMACLLFVCATVQSCRDEYYFDDTAPSHVGPSIYEYLEGEGVFTHFLQVINDLDYDEVLRRTGSKTLFVADDKAFMEGIDRVWGYKEYKQLTEAQKRIILYSAMLDNAYLLEMLSKMQSTGANAEPVPGQCLRRVTSASLADTVPLLSYKDLPKNNKEWTKFETGTIRLALDASSTMMTHFIEDQLYMKNINEHDLRLLVGDPAASLSDIYVYDKKVIRAKSDVICKNGYVHQLEGLLIAPSNMAEELRLNGLRSDGTDVLEGGNANLDDLASSTMLFSRLLDRFAVPKPIVDENNDFVKDFKTVYKKYAEDKLYEKKYYVEGSFTEYEDEDGTHQAVATLLFDPGWNAYTAGTTDKEQDMAAIFAPSDKAVVEYFTTGRGQALLKQYAQGIKDKNIWDINGALVEAIDSIPVDIIQPLVRNHMQMSFNTTVPSKFKYMVDDARDEMKVLEKDIQKIMLANNGVVYVMDTLYSPARYNSVLAPVMLNDTLSIFNKEIKSLQYDKYLLSMGNKFTLIVTSDAGLVYYDPYSDKKQNDHTYEVKDKEAKGYRFIGNIEDEILVVTAQQIQYDRSKYDANTNTYSVMTDVKNQTGNVDNLFKEILEYNILLEDVNAENDRNKRKQYYMAKGYGTVKVERDAEGFVNAISGGREIQNNAKIPVTNSTEMNNGYAIQLDGSLIQPPTQTVFDVLSDNEEFASFNELCDPTTEVLAYFLGSETNDNTKEWNKYRVFYNQIDQHKLVRLFDTYHYTVYVPSNEAMDRAHEQGLPTWDDLADMIEGWNGETNDSLRNVIKTGADLITKFVRYHFQDNSVFVDNVPHVLKVDKGLDASGNRVYEEQTEVTYETSSFNEERNRFSTVLVSTDETKNTISVRGDFGENEDANVCYVIKEDGKENVLYNVMVREIEYSGSSISTSSYAVVHLLDNFLVYGGEGGIYDADKKEFIGGEYFIGGEEN